MSGCIAKLSSKQIDDLTTKLVDNIYTLASEAQDLGLCPRCAFYIIQLSLLHSFKNYSNVDAEDALLMFIRATNKAFPNELEIATLAL